MARTRVLVVDDSALMRQLLTDLINRSPDFEVVGSAPDPYAAWDRIKQLRPDLLTLDVEMPRLDGISFLERLMRNFPMRVVMVSSLTERGCDTTLRALEIGAIDYVAKPKLDLARGMESLGEELLDKLRNAAAARVPTARTAAAPPAPTYSAPAAAAPAAPRPATGLSFAATHKLIAIGASTGGTEALKDVLAAVPADSPGVVIVQHMPPMFTAQFAERLNRMSRMTVKEAKDGDRVLPGVALLAPGGQQMEVVRSGAQYSVKVYAGPPVSRHCPSVDVLFDSCARQVGANAVGVILTGMGDDGAKGMLAMRQAGARTIAQDERTCVVFGMPKEAIARGGVESVLPLGSIGPSMLAMANGNLKTERARADQGAAPVS